MTVDKDVTKKVDFQNNDDESLPITKCVCGETFDAWGFTVSIYRDDARECESCGRKFYFRNEIHVYEVGHKTPSPTVPIEKRFWAKVDVQGDDECWAWLAKKSPKGYGEFTSNIRGGRHTRAHQVAYILANGEFPDGMMVCHKCDNPPCCNPNHLFLGTQQDNVDDMMAKGRHRVQVLYGKEHPQHGTNHRDNKLSEDNVREIRSMYAEGITLRGIAQKFGVVHGVVNNIIQGRKWSWLK